MQKSKINFIIDSLMFLFMASIVGIGLLIKFVLIPGQERWVKYGQNVDLTVLNMDRHEWGTIHLIIGLILIGLLIIHILLHWNIITCVYCKMFKKKQTKKLVVPIFITVIAIILLTPLIIEPEVSYFENAYGNRENLNIQLIENENVIQSDIKNTLSDEENTRHYLNPSVEIRGYMTIAEVSDKYNVPIYYLKDNLNIPNSSSDNQNLGLLRKKHDFKMSDVKQVISNYRK